MIVVTSPDCDCRVTAALVLVEDYRTELEVLRRWVQLCRLWAVVSRGEEAHRHRERYALVHLRGRHVVGVS